MTNKPRDYTLRTYTCAQDHAWISSEDNPCPWCAGRWVEKTTDIRPTRPPLEGEVLALRDELAKTFPDLVMAAECNGYAGDYPAALGVHTAYGAITIGPDIESGEYGEDDGWEWDGTWYAYVDEGPEDSIQGAKTARDAFFAVLKAWDDELAAQQECIRSLLAEKGMK